MAEKNCPRCSQELTQKEYDDALRSASAAISKKTQLCPVCGKEVPD